MSIEIKIDNELIEATKRKTGLSDGTSAVEAILRKVLPRRAVPASRGDLTDLLALAGRVKFFEGFDPKAEFMGARPPLTDEEKKQWCPR